MIIYQQDFTGLVVGSLNGQDSWIAVQRTVGQADAYVQGATPGRLAMRTTKIPMDLNIIYERAIPPHDDYDFNITSKYVPNRIGNLIMAGYNGSDEAWRLSTEVTSTGVGVIAFLDGYGTHVLQAYDFASHVFIVRVTAIGGIIVSIDGIPAYTSSAGASMRPQLDKIRLAFTKRAVIPGAPNPIFTIINYDSLVMNSFASVPTGLTAIRRQNYTVVYWNRPAAGMIAPDRYDVYRSSNINGSDMVLVASVDTLDVNGAVDTVYVDPDLSPTATYRVKAVSGAEESDYTQLVPAIKSPSPIDGKRELLDDRLFILNRSRLNEGLLL